MDTARTDQLHIGNRWIGHKGLDIYDNTARLHDPVLMRFHTPDSKYASYPSHSPWAHCAANPINAIDPNGMAVFFMNNKDELVNIGSDGVEDDRMFIVNKSLGNKIKKLTDNGMFYDGAAGNSKEMAEITDIKEFDTIESAIEAANGDGYERGMHKDSEGNIHHWDKGTGVENKGNFQAHSIKPFREGNRPSENPYTSRWYMHIHPTNKSDSNFGKSMPSGSDKKIDKEMRDNAQKYDGTTFIIGGKDGKVTFYNGSKIISTIPFVQLKNLMR